MTKKEKQRAILVGITGGFFCGKTTAAYHLKDSGYPVLISDDIAKELMENNPELKQQIVEIFGGEAYDSNGKLNKAWLAELVFGSEPEQQNALKRLESIVHPKVIDFLMEEIEKLDAVGNKLIFVESALIYEAGLEDVFDYIITIYADEENIIQRAIDSGKFNQEQAKKRLQSQFPISKKAELSDFAIANNEGKEKLIEKIDWIVNIIRQAHNI